MLYASLHGSRILHGPGHVEAWAMTFSPTYSGDVLVDSLWKALILSWNCHKSFAGSQLVSLSGSPFHLTKYSWHGGKLFFRTTQSAKMVSTSLSYTLVLPSGGRLDSPLFGSSVSPWNGFKELTWKTGWSFRQEGNSSLYDTLPTLLMIGNGPSYFRMRPLCSERVDLCWAGMILTSTMSPTLNSKCLRLLSAFVPGVQPTSYHDTP